MLNISDLTQDKNVVHIGENLPNTFDAAYIDSRKTCTFLGRPGLFFALPGTQTDGHAFVEQVVQNGGFAVISEQRRTEFPESAWPSLISTSGSVEHLLQSMALHRRKRFEGQVIGITGSNGKTTTKNMCRSIAESVVGGGRVLSTAGNLNNHLGVPLTLSRLTDDHRIAIIEMGMNHAGEITFLCDIARPDIGIITTIGTAHMGNFIDGEKGVAQAKGELYSFLELHNGSAVVNAQNTRCLEQYAGRPSLSRNAILVTERPPNNQSVDEQNHKPSYVLTYTKEEQDGMTDSIELWYRDTAIPIAGLDWLGKHLPMTAALSVAAVLRACELEQSSVGLDLDRELKSKIAVGVAGFKQESGRMSLSEYKGVRLVDDAYNANPDSLLLGLQTIQDMPSSGRRALIMGPMYELGDESKTHELITRHIEQNPVDACFLYSDWCAPLLSPLRNHIGHVILEDSHAKLAEAVKIWMQPGDILYIKGSRGAQMEKLISAMTTKNIDSKGGQH